MKILFTSFVTFFFFAIVATNTKAQQGRPGHSSQNSLDWEGTYKGLLPCASCEGIETILTIGRNGKYNISELYVGKAVKKIIHTGTFKWNKSGNSIALYHGRTGKLNARYKVEENQLRKLTIKGKEITGDLAQQYLLYKTGNDYIENNKWALIEFMGKEIAFNPESYYIQFDKKTGRLSAKVGCNVMNFKYLINEKTMIRLEQGMSTMMACPAGSIEDDFKRELLRADNITIGENTLSFNKARMAPLMRFRIVNNAD